jgi:hypothetical protein
MITPTKMLYPLLDHAVTSKETLWPTYDGKLLDRTQFVSSSSVGKCERQIFYANDPTLPRGKFPWGFAQRGHGHEAWIVEQLRSLSCEYTFLFVGDQQRSFYAGNQSGTPDGLARSSSGDFVLEFKSIDPRTKLANLPKPEHVMQCVQNMDLMEQCLDTDVTGALLAYSNASDFSTITEFWVERTDPECEIMMDKLAAKADRIMSAKTADDLEPEGIYTGGCKQCDFGSICSATVKRKESEKNRHEQLNKASSNVFG